MTILAATFLARYKLANFYIANHLFETLIKDSPDFDLTDIKKLQRDGGFFMASLRVIEQLTAFTSGSDLEELKKKVENTGTLFFKKSILTAVVNQGNKKPPVDGEKPELENLYDKAVVKSLYDTYFLAYAVDTEPLEFLDKPSAAQERATNDWIPIYEVGMFDNELLKTVSSILDFTDNTTALSVIETLKTNPNYVNYSSFFKIVGKCI